MERGGDNRHRQSVDQLSVGIGLAELNRLARHGVGLDQFAAHDFLTGLSYHLSNAASLYDQLSIGQKRTLLGVLSPQGFVYGAKNGIRTLASDCLFNGLYALSRPLVKDGVTDGI